MTDLGSATQVEGGEERAAGLWSDAWRELRRNPVFIIASIVVLIIASMAAFPRLWTRADPHRCLLEFSQQRPSWEHIFGFNLNGCDYYALTIYGARPSIVIGFAATIGIGILGGGLGVLAGYYGGVLDAVISRVTDVFLALPFLLAAIVFLQVLQVRTIWSVGATLIVFGWTTIARISRGAVIGTKNMDYVQAAKSLGARDVRIIFRHILPNSLAPMVVYLTIVLGVIIVAEAVLSFLGVGLRWPTVSWGVMITQGAPRAVAGTPHLLLIPAAFLAGTVLSIILIGDALRDALDPKLR